MLIWIIYQIVEFLYAAMPKQFIAMISHRVIGIGIGCALKASGENIRIEPIPG